MTIIILILGLIFLWFGANLITQASLRMARSLALSEGFIGMTVLALGTSFPEITIAVTGALQKLSGQQNSGIVLGNAVGASMNQLILIVSLSGLIRTIKFKRNNIIFDATFVIAVISAFYMFGIDGEISRQEGLIFVLFYAFYLLFLSRRNFMEQIASHIKRKFSRRRIHFMDALQLVFGLIVLAQSSQLVLAKAVLLANQLKVSDSTVGIILLGFGSSLPELVVAINAAIKGATALSLGNLIGGIVVNICLAMGLGAAIAGWDVDRSLVQFDIPYLLFSAVTVILFISSRNKLDRKESFLLLSLYLIYLLLKIMGI